MKKAYSEQINKEMAAQLETIINQNKAKTAELSNFKADNPTAIAGAVQSLASTKPAETEKIIKALPPLMVEYAGKPYGNGKTISVDYSTFGKTFYLKNGEENAETTWLFKSGEEIIKSFAGNLTSIDIDFTEFDAEKLEVYHKTGMYFEVTQGERKVKVMVSTQKLVLEKLTIEDAKHPSRKATTGQTLYLVGEGKINANVSATGFQNPFTNPNLSWSFIREGQSNPQTQFATKSNITYDFKANPVGVDKRTYEIEAQNAVGDDKSVNVVVVDEDGEKEKLTIGSETFGETIKKAFELEKTIAKTAEELEKLPFIKRTKSKFESAGGKIAFYYNAIPFEKTEVNKEDNGSILYYRERKIKGGFEAGIKGEWKYPVWEIPFDKLPIPQSAIDWCKSYVTAEVNIKGKADAGGEIIVEEIDKKWGGNISWEIGKAKINPAQIRLKAEFGAEAEVSILKKSDLFSVVANASGMAKAELLSFGYYRKERVF